MAKNINFFVENIKPKNYSKYINIVHWYHSKIKPSLFYYDDVGNRNISKLCQYGGGVETYTILSEDKEYMLNVDRADIIDDGRIKKIYHELPLKNEDVTEINSENIQINTMSPKYNLDYQGNEILHFFSLKSINGIDESCAVVKIYNKYGIAEIDDINKLNNCFTPTDATKLGDLMIKIVLDYIKARKESLGVNKIILYDKSFYECDGVYDIKLEYSRQLSGLDPYYMKYKFRPSMVSAQAKLNYNKTKLTTVYTRDIIDTTLTKKQKHKFEIINFLLEHSDDLLIDTMAKLGKTNCKFMYIIYDILFNELELEKLLYAESIYELNI